MGLHRTRKGLNLPITGEPEQRVDSAAQPRRVALMADDYVGMKPTMHVTVGDDVRRGQLLFEDKKTEGVRYTAPASGSVIAINRGARRALQSVVIQLDQSELSGGGESVDFASYTGRPPGALSRQEVKDLLVESGLWTALRQRPFSKVANPADTPRSIFVTAADSQPLAPSIDLVLEGKHEHFERGLQAVAKLTDGPVYVCKGPDSAVPVPSDSQFQEEVFSGPHPSGTVGVHIHFLDPVDRSKLVWHLDCQDVAAIGKLFANGRLDVERVISLAGPSARRPRLLRTRSGASTTDLTANEIEDSEPRVVSGSVLSGRTASGDVFGFLGRYHHQISVLHEDRNREFLGWLVPGLSKFSTIRTYVSSWIPGRKFGLSTSRNGSYRAMVPIGMYERMMPMDILPTFLLRALLVGDLERAEELGCLELDEEDLALCSFVCPGKVEYGPLLRQVLTIIEKEG
jgi:Na+-transporting NADH:ubiquinone oxidoreductase subunit A